MHKCGGKELFQKKDILGLFEKIQQEARRQKI